MKASILFTLLALFGAARAASAQTQEDRIAETRARYAADAWPAGVARDGIPIARIAPLGLAGGAPEASGALVVRDFRPAGAAASARAVLRVEAQVLESSEAAHEALLLRLASLSSLAPAPEDRLFGVELGEAGYVGPSGIADGAVSWVAFARGNVIVRVLNVDLAGSPGLDVVGAARAIDAAIAARPALAPGATPPMPEIARLAAPRTAVEAGASVPLDVLATDPAGGAATVRFAVGGSGQGYVEGRDGVPRLFTTGAGVVTVTATAIGSNGTVATRTLAIEVAERG